MTRWGVSPRSVAILAVGLTLGLLLSIGLRGPAYMGGGTSTGAAPPPELGSSRIWTSIQLLEEEQRLLRARLGALRRELAEHQQAASAHTDQLRELQAEVQRQRLIAGLVPVQGSGITVTLDDSTVHIPQNEDSSLYLIHEYELRDLVNLLWMAGSEAIAINDERLVANSSIYCVGSTVMVNAARLSPPYRVQAIGDPRLQLEVLSNPSYLQNLWAKQHEYGLRIEIASAESLTLPAFHGSLGIQHARPGE